MDISEIDVTIAITTVSLNLIFFFPRIQDVEDRLRASEKRFVTLRSGSRQDEGLYKPTS